VAIGPRIVGDGLGEAALDEQSGDSRFGELDRDASLTAAPAFLELSEYVGDLGIRCVRWQWVSRDMMKEGVLVLNAHQNALIFISALRSTQAFRQKSIATVE
jgi:hypothetical protein